MAGRSGGFESWIMFRALMSVLGVFALLILIINAGITGPLLFVYLAAGIGLLGFAVHRFERWYQARKTKPAATPPDR